MRVLCGLCIMHRWAEDPVAFSNSVLATYAPHTDCHTLTQVRHACTRLNLRLEYRHTVQESSVYDL